MGREAPGRAVAGTLNDARRAGPFHQQEHRNRRQHNDNPEETMLTKPGTPPPRARDPITRRLILLAGAALMTASSLHAQEFPNKPLHMIVPSAAGGTFDLSARVVGQGMSRLLGQNVVVENRPGAATSIGADFVANSGKDGYTMLFAAASTLVTVPHLYANLRYKVEDLEPVAFVSKVPVAVVLSPVVPARNIREFAAWAKERPGVANYATTGRGSFPHVASELIARELGIRMVMVPYAGAAQANTDVLAGRIHMYTDAITTAMQNQKAGRVTIIGVLNEQRSALLPDVPTFAESGYPKAVAYTWFGVLVPAGTPRAVIGRLNETVNRTLESAEVKARFAADGQVIETGSPERFRAFIGSELQKYGELIRSAGIRLD